MIVELTTKTLHLCGRNAPTNKLKLTMDLDGLLNKGECAKVLVESLGSQPLSIFKNYLRIKSLENKEETDWFLNLYEIIKKDAFIYIEDGYVPTHFLFKDECFISTTDELSFPTRTVLADFIKKMLIEDGLDYLLYEFYEDKEKDCYTITHLGKIQEFDRDSCLKKNLLKRIRAFHREGVN